MRLQTLRHSIAISASSMCLAAMTQLASCGGDLTVVSGPAATLQPLPENGAPAPAHVPWQLERKLTRNVSQPGDELGKHFAVSGDTILASSKARTAEGKPTNAIYVFELNDGTWAWTQRFELGDVEVHSIAMEGPDAIATLRRDIRTGYEYTALTFYREARRWDVGKKILQFDFRDGEDVCSVAINNHSALVADTSGVRVFVYFFKKVAYADPSLQSLR
jgi:hypothetical protein